MTAEVSETDCSFVRVRVICDEAIKRILIKETIV